MKWLTGIFHRAKKTAQPASDGVIESRDKEEREREQIAIGYEALGDLFRHNINKLLEKERDIVLRRR
jgi:hypothetical protein